MNKQKMGTFLINLRKERNLTQSDLSEVLTLSPQAISKWESGDSVPDIDTLEKLSKFYNISIEEIINGEKRTQEPVIIEPIKTIKINNSNKINLKTDLFSFIFGATLFLFMICVYFADFYSLQATINKCLILTGYRILFNSTGLLTTCLCFFTISALLSMLINIGLWLSNNKKPYYITRLVSSIISVILLIIIFYEFDFVYNTDNSYLETGFYVLNCIYLIYFILILVLPFTNHTHFFGKRIKKSKIVK